MVGVVFSGLRPARAPFILAMIRRGIDALEGVKKLADNLIRTEMHRWASRPTRDVPASVMLLALLVPCFFRGFMTFVEPFLSGSTEVAALLVVLGIHATRIVLRLAESACGVDTHNIFCRPYTAIVVGLELRSRVGSVLLWSVITALAAILPDSSLWSPVSGATVDEGVAAPQPKRPRVARAERCSTSGNPWMIMHCATTGRSMLVCIQHDQMLVEHPNQHTYI